jgi:hypothetical protein
LLSSFYTFSLLLSPWLIRNGSQQSLLLLLLLLLLLQPRLLLL